MIWSFETLATKGQPRYTGAWKRLPGPRSPGHAACLYLQRARPRLPLILGLPDCRKRVGGRREFDESTLIHDGLWPLYGGQVTVSRSVTFRRNPDWWGKDLPFNRGQHNLDEIRIEYFGVDTALSRPSRAAPSRPTARQNPGKWLGNFNFPAVTSGEVLKVIGPHQRPSGIEGFRGPTPATRCLPTGVCARR